MAFNYREFLFSAEWLTFRLAILTRDGFRCIYCGMGSGESSLHVHHMRPIWLGGGLTDPSNCITLCCLCHSGVHSSFLGRGLSDPRQLGFDFAARENGIIAVDDNANE